jgi:hypothetical protein
VVIHHRLLINNNVVQLNSPENTCLECTVLKVGGENEVFTKVLFRVPAVNVYVNRGEANIVMYDPESCYSVCFNGQSTNNPATRNHASGFWDHCSLNIAAAIIC